MAGLSGEEGRPNELAINHLYAMVTTITTMTMERKNYEKMSDNDEK